MPSSTPDIPPRLWAVAAITGAGAFMAMLDSTVVNLGLETVRAGFAAPLTTVQWVATGYLIALAVSLPLTGWLGRRYGTGRLWGASTAAFMVASIACALSHSLATLIVSRCLQGLAAGLMVPAGQAVLAATAERRQLGRLMGTVGFAVALGPALGPGLGGVLIEAASWRWLFWINVPVGAAALAAGFYAVPPGETSGESRLDGRGLTLIGPGLPLLLYGTAGIGSTGLAALPLASAVAGALLSAGFLLHAFRARAPLVDIRLFRRPGFAAAVITACLTGAAMYGGLLLLPLFLQSGMGLSPGAAGLMLVAMGLGSAFALPFAGALTDRFGAASVCLGGAVLLCLGTLPFLTPCPKTAAAVAMLLLARGAGLAFAQMPAMTAAYGAVAAGKTGDAATLVNIAQRLGGALGAIATVVALEEAAVSTGAAPYLTAFILLFLFAAGALAMAPRLGPIGKS